VILVDTTVWVDLFKARNTPQVRRLESLIQESIDICVCGVILAEVLQGIRKDEEYQRTLSRLDSLLYLPMGRHTFIKAADLYRALRRKGITVRKPVDCMIAAVALEYGVALLHNDRDFDPISRHCGLEVVKTGK
jgi:predicted nucleic acid-binding protein